MYNNLLKAMKDKKITFTHLHTNCRITPLPTEYGVG